MGEREEPRTQEGVHEAISDLQVRVTALERSAASLAPRPSPLALDLGVIDVPDLTDAAPDPNAPTGTVTYAGVASFTTGQIAWQMTHAVPDLLALDDNLLARQIAAIASPVRIRILRELVGGPLQTQELQARLDEPSAGQLYHHLRELLAAGLVHQPRRSVYDVPDRAVIPLLALIACAGDLARAARVDTAEAP